jgi:predicted nucleotidyltransferase
MRYCAVWGWDRGGLYNNRVMNLRSEVPREALEEICRRYHVKRLSLFGSVLREDFGPESDLDVLVEFEPVRTPGFGFVELQRELSELMGHPVDLHTYRSLSRYFRDDVVRQSQPLYEPVSRVS